MARTYKRDANGRFAGGGGGGGRKGVKLPAPKARKVGSKPQQRRGLITQRAAVKSTKAKLAAKDPADRSINGQLSRRSQKGAVTKASNALAAAKQSGRVRLSGRSGVLRPGARRATKASATGTATKLKPMSARNGTDRVLRAAANYRRATARDQTMSPRLLAESNALLRVKNKTPAQQRRLQEISSEWRRMRRSGETARQALIRYGEKPGQKGSRRLTRMTKADLKAAQQEAAGKPSRRR